MFNDENIIPVIKSFIRTQIEQAYQRGIKDHRSQSAYLQAQQ